MSDTIAIAGRSDVGKVRRRNEDSYAVFPDLGIAVVADGMGGHPGGDVASRIAADAAADALADAVREGATRGGFAERFREVMREAILMAHGDIREEGRANPELDGMGTTLTAMVVDPEAGTWIIGHVGDSRTYRLREGEIHQLTRDDTWVQDQIDRGEMQPESARLSPYAHLLTQCVGLEDEPTPQILDGASRVGDAYLLCTDGLVGMLDDHQIARVLENGGGEPGDSLKALIDAANKAGGHDNITAALIRFA